MAAGADTLTAPPPAEAHEAKAAVRLVGGRKDVGEGMTAPQRAHVEAFTRHVTESNGHGAIELLAHEPEPFKFEKTWKDTLSQTIEDPVVRAQVERDAGVQIEFVNKGFDGLTADPFPRPPGRTVVEKQLWLGAQVRNHLDANPALKDALADASGNINGPTLLNILRENPTLRSDVAGRLNELFDPKNLPTTTEWQDAKNNQDAKDREVQSLKDKTADAKGRLTRHTDAKDKFDTDTSYKGTKTKLEVYDELDKSADVMRYKLAREQLDIATKSGNLLYVDKARTALDGLLTGTGNNDIAEFVKLDNEKSGIESGIVAETAAIKTTELELKVKEGEKATVDRAFNRINTAKDAVAEGMSRELSNVVGETARANIVKRARELIDKIPEYRTELADQLKAEADKKIQDHIKERWEKAEKYDGMMIWKHGEMVYSFDKDASKKDLDAISGNADGPRAFLTDVLTKTILDEHGSPDRGKIDALMANKDFVDAQTKALAGKAIAAHIGAGGNLSREMKGMLENSTFGKEVWADMIKASPEATQAAKVLTGGAELTPATIDALKKKKKEKAVMSLLLVALGAITMEAFNSSLPQAA